MMNSQFPAIVIDHVSKTYKATKKSAAKVALDNVSLTIPRGSIYGLLGPNGAGKSTLINIMAGMVIKSAGTVKIWDTDIDDDPRQARNSIGIVPQEITFDPFFTPHKILDLQAGMYGVPPSERRTGELLDLVGLTDKANAYTRALSGGMRRRLMVAKAMVHTPPILVLDEPTAGVDLEMRQQLWENVRALNRKGVTILLTTHYLEEAEELCDRIAIINKGKIVADAPKLDLLSSLDGKTYKLRVAQDVGEIPSGLSAKYSVRMGDRHTLIVHIKPKEQPTQEMFDAVKAAGFAITDVATEDRKLEDVFLHFTTA
jgi:ABC-2 type transport system ATP-binding protein